MFEVILDLSNNKKKVHNLKLEHVIIDKLNKTKNYFYNNWKSRKVKINNNLCRKCKINNINYYTL